MVEICEYISSEFSQMKTININVLGDLPASVLDLKQYHEEINYNLPHNKKTHQNSSSNGYGILTLRYKA